MKVNQERLIAQFIELVKIDSETRNEGKIQPYLKGIFTELGLTVEEDNTMGETGYGANNLLCTLAGDADTTPIFFSSHMDTVVPGVNIQPIIKDGAIYSDGTTILGADDKAGIAIMIELIHLLKEEKIKHGTLEFVITVGEESGLVGAKAFDVNRLQAPFGFVLDTGGPVGAITIGSPTQYHIDVILNGVTAHAGVAPEKGVSAVQIASNAIHQMKLGRIDEMTTANIGFISGGTATNIVMDRLEIVAEARSLSPESGAAQVKHMEETFIRVAKEMGGSAEVIIKKMYDGYLFDAETPVVKMAAEGMKQAGIASHLQKSGGGSDANIFNGKGKPTTNLSVGYQEIHTVKEYMPIDEFVKAVEMAFGIVSAVAAQ